MLNFLTLIILSMQLIQPGRIIMQTHYSGNVKSTGAGAKLNPQWNAATYRGLTMGRSTENDMIQILGQPKWWELLDENKSQPERWFHYDSGADFPGELVVNIDTRSRVILRMTLHPKDLSAQEAIKRFGENYVVTRYEFCPGFDEEDSGPIYENPSGQFRYIEYRKRGIALLVGDNDKVDYILYVSAPIGTTSSKCKKASE